MVPRTALGLALFFYLCLLAACSTPVSQSPVSHPGEFPLDSQLEGTWYLKTKDGHGYYHINRNRHDVFEVVTVGFENGRGLETKGYVMHNTPVGDHGIINLGIPPEGAEEQNGNPVEYLLALYRIADGKRLTLTFLSEDKAAEAVRAGALDGDLDFRRGKVTQVKLTASSERLMEFFKQADLEAVFSDPDSVKFFKENNPLVKISEPPLPAP